VIREAGGGNASAIQKSGRVSLPQCRPAEIQVDEIHKTQKKMELSGNLWLSSDIKESMKRCESAQKDGAD